MTPGWALAALLLTAGALLVRAAHRLNHPKGEE